MFQVHSAPSVNLPEHRQDSTGFVPVVVDTPSTRLREEELRQEHSEVSSPASYSSPTMQPKLAFGLKKTPASNTTPSSLPVQTNSKLDSVFTTEEDEVEKKPKKKLVPIEYSDEEKEASSGSSPVHDRERKRSRRSSGKSSSGRSSNHSSDLGTVVRGIASLSEGFLEDGKERKLTTEERKKMVQTLVNNIPTVKEEVFQYQLKWDQIDKVHLHT